MLTYGLVKQIGPYARDYPSSYQASNTETIAPRYPYVSVVGNGSKSVHAERRVSDLEKTPNLKYSRLKYPKEKKEYGLTINIYQPTVTPEFGNTFTAEGAGGPPMPPPSGDTQGPPSLMAESDESSYQTASSGQAPSIGSNVGSPVAALQDVLNRSVAAANELLEQKEILQSVASSLNFSGSPLKERRALSEYMDQQSNENLDAAVYDATQRRRSVGDQPLLNMYRLDSALSDYVKSSKKSPENKNVEPEIQPGVWDPEKVGLRFLTDTFREGNLRLAEQIVNEEKRSELVDEVERASETYSESISILAKEFGPELIKELFGIQKEVIERDLEDLSNHVREVNTQIAAMSTRNGPSLLDQAIDTAASVSAPTTASLTSSTKRFLMNRMTSKGKQPAAGESLRPYMKARSKVEPVFVPSPGSESSGPSLSSSTKRFLKLRMMPEPNVQFPKVPTEPVEKIIRRRLLETVPPLASLRKLRHQNQTMGSLGLGFNTLTENMALRKKPGKGTIPKTKKPGKRKSKRVKKNVNYSGMQGSEASSGSSYMDL